MRPLSIAIISSEVSPFSKSGGLGDVAHALPKHLYQQGHHVSVVTPYYRFIDQQNLEKTLLGEGLVTIGPKQWRVKFLQTTLSPQTPLPVYFIYQEELFSSHSKLYNYPDDATRFAVFNRAVFLLYQHLGQAPDVLHCHDWQAGLIPNYLRLEFAKEPFWKNTACVFTIHNLLYQMQGMWYEIPDEKRDQGRNLPPTDLKSLRYTNFTLRAIKHADAISTVSERYAEEILTKKFGEGLDGWLRRRKDRVFGIINGIDYTIFNPSFDQHLAVHYDWNSLDKKEQNKLAFQRDLGLSVAAETPLIGMDQRLTEQKGFNLIMEILPFLFRQDIQLAVVGSGDRDYIKFFRAAAKKYPHQIAISTPFTEEMGSRVLAGSDIFLMPSRYEPCGISQMKSLRYGSIPIVHQTGGLADTITDFNPRTGVGTGFVFQTYQGADLLMALTRAIETYKYPRVWEHLTWQAMRQSFSWELPAKKYVQLYRQAINFYHAVG